MLDMYMASFPTYVATYVCYMHIIITNLHTYVRKDARRHIHQLIIDLCTINIKEYTIRVCS